MKLNSVFVCVLSSIMLFSSVCHAAHDKVLEKIRTRGTVYCGTNRNDGDLAYKDEEGIWRGFDASLCRAIAAAVLGDKERFEMKPIRIDSVPQALKSGAIDVMFGEFALPAETEITSNVLNMDVLYYEKIMILAHKKEGATSLEAYKGSQVCLVTNSIDTYYFNNFIYKYNLKLQPIYYPTRDRAIEGFYLNRCDLLPGASNELKTILNTKMKGKSYVELIPETIGLRPVYLMIDKDSLKLGITVKWIINALRLAETYDINSNNLPMMIGDKDPSIQNLLGNQPRLWKKFSVYPKWMRKYIAEEGNFREIYERYLGPGTSVDLNSPEPEKGLAIPKPFI